jgi:hypothetical protein
VRLVGWIEGTADDIEPLRSLGVTGAMTYAPETRSINYCEIGWLRMLYLMWAWPKFWPGAFSPLSQYPRWIERLVIKVTCSL